MRAKPCVQVATGQVPDHDLFEVGSPEAVTFLESFRVNLFEGFIVVLDALVEGGQMRLSGMVDRAGFGHRFVHRQTGEEGGSSSQGALKGQEVCQGGGWSEGARPGCRPDLPWCAAGYTQRRWDTVGI